MSKHIHLTLALAGAAVIALSVGIGAGAGASPLASPHSSVTHVDPTHGDVAPTSTELVDEDEQEALASWQPEAGRIAGAIRGRFPDDFVATSSTIDRFSITFAGAAPEEAVELLGAIPVPVDIVEGVGIPEVTTLQVVDEVGAAIAPVLPDGIGYSISPDPAAKTIAVVIHRIAGVDASTSAPRSVRMAVQAAVSAIDPRGLTITVLGVDAVGGEDS